MGNLVIGYARDDAASFPGFCIRYFQIIRSSGGDVNAPWTIYTHIFEDALEHGPGDAVGGFKQDGDMRHAFAFCAFYHGRSI